MKGKHRCIETTTRTTVQLGYGKYGTLKIITINYMLLGTSFPEICQSKNEVCKTFTAKKDTTFDDS